MAIEHASVQVARKPWGVADIRPWSCIDVSGDPVGELLFERVDKDAPGSALLLKLLFTSQPLSIQVHPTMNSRTPSICRTERPRHGTSCRQRRARG